MLFARTREVLSGLREAVRDDIAATKEERERALYARLHEKYKEPEHQGAPFRLIWQVPTEGDWVTPTLIAGDSLDAYVELRTGKKQEFKVPLHFGFMAAEMMTLSPGTWVEVNGFLKAKGELRNAPTEFDLMREPALRA